MTKYQRKPEGTRYNPAYGRIMTHEGYATRIFWSKAMLDYLRRHFATTLNDELAGCLGVSRRTMIRKARELGLEKDHAWLAGVWEERRLMAQSATRRHGNSGQFKKGCRFNPEWEFGRRPPLTDEQRRKQSEGLKRWNLLHPEESRARARKAWETRRARKAQRMASGNVQNTG